MNLGREEKNTTLKRKHFFMYNDQNRGEKRANVQITSSRYEKHFKMALAVLNVDCLLDKHIKHS